MDAEEVTISFLRGQIPDGLSNFQVASPKHRYTGAPLNRVSTLHLCMYIYKCIYVHVIIFKRGQEIEREWEGTRGAGTGVKGAELKQISYSRMKF